ncbi:hypothetical protein ABHF91_16375 [Pseudaeromonas sp. ZJS20]|uniref:hypothetical protein n=1 Tax=Pseudaeromonas aegiceratis TaxID=3153928 RepID=UPI00390C83D6
MAELLKYISLITLCGTAISFAVGLIKWIDQRNREQEQKQFEAFHKMVCIASGVNESGQTVKMVQQIAAIYQLQAYKQYAFAAVPVLELLLFEYDSAKDSRTQHLDKAIKETLYVLSKH